MPARAYITPLPEAALWHDLDQLATEEGVLAWFRSPERRYNVVAQPPQFRIQKAQPTRWSTVFWTQVTGRIEQRAGQTWITLRAGFTNEARFRNGIAWVFLLLWPPLWLMLFNPSTWPWALPLTVVFGSIAGVSIYWPVWAFRRFLVNRWQLQRINSDKTEPTMKTTFFLLLIFLLTTLVQAQEMVRVNGWKSPLTQDFETIQESRNSDAQLQNRDYLLKT